jgi:hypothetical protein
MVYYFSALLPQSAHHSNHRWAQAYRDIIGILFLSSRDKTLPKVFLFPLQKLKDVGLLGELVQKAL